MTDSRAVHSSGNTGPSDFSEQVHANFAAAAVAAPDLPVHFTASVELAESAAFSVQDLFDAIIAVLKAHGVPSGHHYVDVVRDDAGGRYPDLRLQGAVRLIHPGWTTAEVSEEVQRIKSERGAGDPL